MRIIAALFVLLYLSQHRKQSKRLLHVAIFRQRLSIVPVSRTSLSLSQSHVYTFCNCLKSASVSFEMETEMCLKTCACDTMLRESD